MRSLGLLTLRLAAGVVLIGHGYTKLFGGRGKRAPEALESVYGPNFPDAVEGAGPEKFAETLERIEVPAPKAAAVASGLAEFGGGLAFVLGFKTRLAAPAVLFNMVTAIRKVHWERGMYGEGGFEFPLMLAAAAATLLFTGPGALSLDGVRSAGKKITGGDDD